MTERVLGWYDHCVSLRSVSLRDFNAAGAWPDGYMGRTGPSRSTSSRCS